MQIQPFASRSLRSLTTLINAALDGRRAAARVSVEDFRSRVLDHPGFDPNGLLTASRGGVLQGAIHAIIPPTEMERYARLGDRGFLMGPFVAPDARGKGVGRRLLSAAESYLRGNCTRILVHGLRAPFYHAQEGPRQPYSGSTEIVGLTRDDAFLLDFFSRAGYRPVRGEREVSMLASLHSLAVSPPGGTPFAQSGADLVGRDATEASRAPFEGLLPEAGGLPVPLEWIWFSHSQPWRGPVDYGGAARDLGYENFRPMGKYVGLGIRNAHRLVGDCIWFPMRRPGRAALYSLRLAEDWRGQGLGWRLLDEGLRIMRRQGYAEVELHTSPDRNGVAYAMYSRRGFRDVMEWVVLEKRL
jgi:GNAT superfamily N-acetyltransferase